MCLQALRYSDFPPNQRVYLLAGFSGWLIQQLRGELPGPHQ
jgi:hypothetical protein